MGTSKFSLGVKILNLVSTAVRARTLARTHARTGRHDYEYLGTPKIIPSRSLRGKFLNNVV